MKRKLRMIFAAALASSAFAFLSPAAHCSTVRAPFALCEYEGKIAAFENEELIAVYDTPIDSLYPADVKLLEEGICLKTRAELSRLIEDLDLE